MKGYSLLFALGTLSSVFGQNLEQKAKEYCELAASAENYASYCNAVAYYRKAEQSGKSQCHDKAASIIERYGAVCRDTSVDENVAMPDNAGRGNSICQDAMAKLNAKKFCDAAEDFIRAYGTGVTDSDCQFKANFVFSEYQDLCRLDLSRIKAVKKNNVNYLCKEAAKAKNNNAVCDSYSLYRMAMNETEYAFEQCFAEAVPVLEAYSQQCQTVYQIDSSGTNGESGDELCQLAAEAKLNDHDACLALDYYQQALAAGGLSERCRMMALKNIQAYGEKCDVDIPADLLKDDDTDPAVKDANEICKKAVELMRGSDKCGALVYYRKAVEIGGSKARCYKAAFTFMDRYENKCAANSSDAEVNRTPQETASIFCQRAKTIKEKYKDKCLALSYDRKALLTGATDENCTTLALKDIEQYASECDSASKVSKSELQQKFAGHYCEMASSAMNGARKDICKAVSSYKRVLGSRNADVQCIADAKAAINKYIGQCGSATKTVTQGDRDKAAEYCKTAAEHKKNNDICSAIFYYKRALATGGADANCKQLGAQVINHSSECKGNSIPKTASAQVRAEEYCREAVIARIGPNRNVCKALSLYKKALNTGAANVNCKKGATMALEKYSVECDGVVYKEPENNSSEWCKKASEAKKNPKDICNALIYYKNAVLSGKGNQCMDDARKVIVQYSEQCRKTVDFPDADIDNYAKEIATNMCKQGANAKYNDKDVCKARLYYKKAIEAFATDKECLNEAISTIEQYSAQCTQNLDSYKTADNHNKSSNKNTGPKDVELSIPFEDSHSQKSRSQNNSDQEFTRPADPEMELPFGLDDSKKSRAKKTSSKKSNSKGTPKKKKSKKRDRYAPSDVVMDLPF